MLSSLYAKLIAAAAVLALLAGGLLWFGSHERGIGAAGVQAKWDEAKLAQASVVANARAANAAQALDWTKQFSAIDSHYEAASHAQIPAIADSVAAGVHDGSVRLRDGSGCPVRPDTVPAATARARVADAAAAAAATQRLADSVAAVRVGDAADAREHQLGQQVIALQAVLTAERQN